MNTEAVSKPLTARQAEVLEFIRKFHADNRIGLGVRDIQKAFDFASPTGALAHLWPLRNRGYVTWVEGRANSIIPTEVQHGD